MRSLVTFLAESRMIKLFEGQQKWLARLRLLASFGSVQIVIQVLGFLNGILIVRYLSKPDYAWFTIATALVSTLGMLADCGVSGALSAIGGRVWQDNVRFGSLIRTALTLRRALALWSVLIVTPLFLWLLVKNQAPAEVIAVLLPAAMVGFLLQLSATVLSVVLLLRQEIRQIQSLGFLTAVFRFALIGSACLVFIDARVATIAGTIAIALNAWLVRKWAYASVDSSAPIDAEYRTEILSVVKRQAPLTIFYCLHGQISVWLISIFGGALRVAEIGALGRFAAIFTVVTSVMSGVVVPRFARCQDAGTLWRRYWQIFAGFALGFGILVVGSALFPGPLLWILGAKYANLEGDVWLMMLTSAVGSMLTTLQALNFSKAWIPPALVSIPMDVITLVILVMVCDISTVRGVLTMSCLGFVPHLFLNSIVAHRGLKKLASAPNPPMGEN